MITICETLQNKTSADISNAHFADPQSQMDTIQSNLMLKEARENRNAHIKNNDQIEHKWDRNLSVLVSINWFFNVQSKMNQVNCQMHFRMFELLYWTEIYEPERMSKLCARVFII